MDITVPPSTMQSAGHLLVAQLEAHGVKRAYLVPGESYLDVLDGLHDSSIAAITCRQEGGAGYMAVAEGRMTGVPGIAMVTRGPGAANVMVSVHTAHQDSTPLVVFVGLIPTAQRSREAFQEFDLGGWFGSTVKKVFTLDDPDKAAEVVAAAMHLAVSGRPGPVVVGLPEEVLTQPSAGVVVPPKTVGHPVASPEQIVELSERIEAAERPVLIIGGEDWDPQTSAVIAGLATMRGVAVLGTFRAYDGVDHSCPNFVGILGFGAAPVAKRTFAEADLHVFLGCVRSDVPTDGYSLGTEQETVVIGPDPVAVGHFGRLDQHIITTLPELARVMSGGGGADPHAEDSTPAWIQTARAEFEAWRIPRLDKSVAPQATVDEDQALTSAGDGIPTPASAEFVDMDEAFVHVKDLLPDDTIITYGAGNYAGWATRFLPTHEFPSALGPRNGSMGFGIPAAVAAGLVHPERTVFSIAGDGCFLMNGQEIATAVQHGVNLTIVVNDNSVYGTIRGHQDREYPGRATGTSLVNPDFAALATAYGGLGIRVERTGEFREAFARALAYDGVALVHCLTDPAIRGPRL